MKHFVMITMGTGLGSGIVVNGDVHYGHDGMAGEIGHTTFRKDGRVCACGKKGCLEAYVSAAGIVKTVLELLENSGQSNALKNISGEDLTSKHIYDEALKENPIALKAFDITNRMLGEALADTVAHLSPEAIVLYGGLAQAGEFMLKSVKEHMETNLFHVYHDKVKIIPSALPAGDAAILGAGALIWKELNR